MKQNYILHNADGSGIQIMELIAQKIRFQDGAEFSLRMQDGGMLVGYPNPNARAKYADDFAAGKYSLIFPTVEECVGKWKQPETVTLATKRKIIQSDIPVDRVFRAAWKDGLTKIDVDMPKARNIWRDKMRDARAPKLATLDAAYMKADEAGDAQGKKTIAAQKQVLRDVTSLPAIEAAATPDALRAVWPAELQ